MGRNSVDATNVLRICAVRAIRSDLLLAEAFAPPGFAFALLGWPVLLLVALVPLDVDVFLPEVEGFAAGF